jgi:hypothetical protein
LDEETVDVSAQRQLAAYGAALATVFALAFALGSALQR